MYFTLPSGTDFGSPSISEATSFSSVARQKPVTKSTVIPGYRMASEPQGLEGGMRDFCYIAIGVFRRRKFTRGTEASIGNPEARPLCETRIPPVLSTVARRGAFAALSETTSFFLQCHKGLAMAFSCQEAIG